MSPNLLPSPALLAALAALAGLMLGLGYFRSLRWTAGRLAGGRGWLGPAVFTLARLAGAAIVLALLARLGAPALLAGFVGFLLARAIALRAARGAA